ncbi:MAG: DUF6232 family protein [Cyanobacteriota bacterium]|jgi:hypothetical protein
MAANPSNPGNSRSGPPVLRRGTSVFIGSRDFPIASIRGVELSRVPRFTLRQLIQPLLLTLAGLAALVRFGAPLLELELEGWVLALLFALPLLLAIAASRQLAWGVVLLVNGRLVRVFRSADRNEADRLRQRIHRKLLGEGSVDLLEGEKSSAGF